MMGTFALRAPAVLLLLRTSPTMRDFSSTMLGSLVRRQTRYPSVSSKIFIDAVVPVRQTAFGRTQFLCHSQKRYSALIKPGGSRSETVCKPGWIFPKEKF